MPLNSPSHPDVLEEGVLVKSRTKINFIGDAVTATDDSANAKVDITVTSGSGVVDTSGTPVANDYARFTDADTIEGREKSQVLADLNVEDGANAYTHPNHSGEVTSVADGAQTIATAAVTLAKMADMATASLIYRKTAATGVPEVNSLATVKTDLGLTGTNSGDNPGVTAVTGTSPVVSSEGATPAISMPAATNAAAGHATAAHITAIEANTNKVTNATHSGDATGATELTIPVETVTYAKMQHVSATDKVLGRSTAGAGDVEEIACTAAGRALLDDATAADQLVTLGDAAAAVSAVEAAGLTFVENKGLILDAALSADEKWSGIVEAGVAGTTLDFGDLIYHDVTEGEWMLAKADATATSGAVKLGINVTVAQASNGGAITVLLFGKVRSDTDYAFTVDAPVFIDAGTAGDMTPTRPTGTTNFVVRIVGYGNTADELFFCPDNTYLELA